MAQTPQPATRPANTAPGGLLPCPQPLRDALSAFSLDDAINLDDYATVEKVAKLQMGESAAQLVPVLVQHPEIATFFKTVNEAKARK